MPLTILYPPIQCFLVLLTILYSPIRSAKTNSCFPCMIIISFHFVIGTQRTYKINLRLKHSIYVYKKVILYPLTLQSLLHRNHSCYVHSCKDHNLFRNVLFQSIPPASDCDLYLVVQLFYLLNHYNAVHLFTAFDHSVIKTDEQI